LKNVSLPHSLLLPFREESRKYGKRKRNEIPETTVAVHPWNSPWPDRSLATFSRSLTVFCGRKSSTFDGLLLKERTCRARESYKCERMKDETVINVVHSHRQPVQKIRAADTM